MSVITQYIIVFVILALVLAWIIYKLFSKKGRNSSSCCGCSMAQVCADRTKATKKSEMADCCSEKHK